MSVLRKFVEGFAGIGLGLVSGKLTQILVCKIVPPADDPEKAETVNLYRLLLQSGINILMNIIIDSATPEETSTFFHKGFFIGEIGIQNEYFRLLGRSIDRYYHIKDETVISEN